MSECDGNFTFFVVDFCPSGNDRCPIYGNTAKKSFIHRLHSPFQHPSPPPTYTPVGLHSYFVSSAVSRALCTCRCR